MHVNDPDTLREFEQEQFKIIRKPPETMLAMRRLVYDNDHQAQDLKKEGFPARWAGKKQSKWNEKDTSFLKIEGADGDNVDWSVRYRHYLCGTFFRDDDGMPSRARSRPVRSSPISRDITPTNYMGIDTPARIGSAISCSNATSRF